MNNIIAFEHIVIQQTLEHNPVYIKKVSPTVARWVKNEEIGTTLVTYVLHSNGRDHH